MRKTMRLLIIGFVMSLVPDQTEECAASGICGANPYCQGAGGYQQAYRPPCAGVGGVGAGGGGCGGGGYGCGPYGCYRMRARAATSFQPVRSRSRDALLSSLREFDPDQQPADELSEVSPSLAAIRRTPSKPVNPNKAFLECCIDRKLPDACLEKCHFGVYNKDALTRMYFKQDACPLEAMSEIQFCAAQGRDHRECCLRNGVTTTLAGQKCLTFCDQRPGHVTQLDLSYVPCFDRFESMKSCFWHDLSRFYRA